MSPFRLAAWLVLGVSSVAYAGIRKVVVESKTTMPLEQTGGVPYEQIQGVAYGDLDPTTKLNSIIQDIDLAKRNSKGRVEYAETFTLLIPAAVQNSSGYLVYEVVNRGNSIVPRDYTSHDIFLRSGWQGDIPFRGRGPSGQPAETLQVPVARNADGSSVTSPWMMRFLNVVNGTPSVSTRLAVAYATSGVAPLPADLDTAHSRLTVRSYEGIDGASSPWREIPSDAWRWADCSKTPFPGEPTGASVCLRDGFKSNLVYQIEFTAKDPLVLGVGLAAVRDTVSFFAHTKQDDFGWENPVSVQIKHVVGVGASQSGNLLRTYLNLGFNQDEDGHRVFDGIMPRIASRQNPINYRFAIPGGGSDLYGPGSDGVLWWGEYSDTKRKHPSAGLLTRCQATRTCPKVTEVLGASEFWSLRASPGFVGTNNLHDLPLPANVRRYYIASTQHGGGTGGFKWAAGSAGNPISATSDNPLASAGCALPVNPNPVREIMAAVLVALKQWVSDEKEPPPSSYPTLRDGTLAAADARAMHFPQLPNFPSPDGVVNPLIVYDLGDSFRYNDVSGIISNQGRPIIDVIPAMVPVVNEDGNEVGGIHTVLQEAALGTYTGWNITSDGFLKGQVCGLRGAYSPFAKTRSDRIASHDPRMSLEERYGTQKGYVCVVQKAATNLVQRRLLLQKDADEMIRQATVADILPAEGSGEQEAIAARRCQAK